MQARIPDVTLLEEVGRGPGSVVFRALHRGTGCRVKLPGDRISSYPAPPTSFEQDMLQLARLSRAGLPRVLLLGVTGETPYAILDEAQGEPLTAVLRRPLSERTALGLAHALASCLQRLHEAGFVHGHLRGEDVLVSEHGQRVTVSDQGSISRPVPFDAHADLRALGGLLQDLGRHAQGAGWARARLLRFGEALADGTLTELTTVILGLGSASEPAAKRSASYPPPSRESLAISPTMPASTRARGELRVLRRMWEQTAERGGRVVEVVGPAGSGKSRLLAAFADQLADDDVLVLSVRCRDSDWEPFSALKRLLEGHLAGLGVLEASRRVQLEESLRSAAGPMGSRIRLLSPRLAALFPESSLSIPGGDAQQVFVAGMAEFLATYIEASGRSVFVIDDVHWLDASSRMVLSRLAARLCGQGHLFVCAARDDTESREPLERFGAMLTSDHLERITLGPLSERDASDLIADYLGLEQRPEPELVQKLAQLSDGTPLSLLELLRLTLERGHLRPSWGEWYLDAGPLQRMRLPASSQAIIRGRLAALETTPLELLRTAAVIRDRLEPALLARMHHIGIETVRAALDAACAARLLEKDLRGQYCFVHDCVWEELLRGIPPEQRRALQQRAADVLYAQDRHGAADDYELAGHHAAGQLELAPAPAFEPTRRAARLAVEACDDSLALSFLKPAETAARLAGIAPDRRFYVELAETCLRLGDTRESRAYFELALSRSQPGIERAYVRGRIAWIHHFDSNALTCWRSLEAALADCGRTLPGDDPRALAHGLRALMSGKLRRGSPALPRDYVETVCGLYADCSRVAFDEGQPLRGVACVVELAALAPLLGPSRLLVRFELLAAVAFTSLGLPKLASARIARAETCAHRLGDPIAQALCHQIRHVVAGWRGDLAESERQARICVEQRGQWIELGELCHVCFAMYGIEVARGRLGAALIWLEKAIERVRQYRRAPAIFALVEDAACSTLLALDREKDVLRLKRQLQFVERPPVQAGSYFYLLSYQSRIQRFTESGDLGEEFEALVREFEHQNVNPKRSHPLVLVFYIHLAHARVHQCLRAEPAVRVALLPKLRRALRDLEAASRMDAIAAHARLIRAAYEWFSGARAQAERYLIDAERLALEHGVVWVSFAAARLRAHILRAFGKLEAAHNQAHVAAMLARQYGHQNRARFLREEFDLAPLVEPGRSDVDAPYPRRHLAALLRIGQANSRELGPERQTRLILDELLEALGAERALLFMRDARSQAFRLTAARTLGGHDLELTADYDVTLVEQVYVSGQTQLAETILPSGDGPRVCAVVALVLREQAVGALYLDRAEAAGGFRAEDAALLQALANQVPVALELASALRERERLQQNLRQAQKMEAIGRLAGGIAHDFNNILAAIEFAADSLAGMLSHGQEGRDELSDIQESARRGAELTRQLLTFSRGKTVPPRRILLGDIVRALVPVLRRIVRSDVRLELEIAPSPLPAMADPSHIERVLMNLCQNASDAMPHGGTLAITVQDASWGNDRPPASELRQADSYVLLTVSDTGCGMNEEVRARLFEPFFTTKAGGTGLGLANVYAIVQQCSGQIEVHTEPGSGSTFRIYLPRAEAAEVEMVPPLTRAGPPAIDEDDLGGAAVLVVEDDEEVRREMAGALETAGYQVLAACDGPDALAQVDALDGLLDVVLTDLALSGMQGLQLADALLARDPDIKLIFLSDASLDETQLQELRDRNGTLLVKPFTTDVLLDKVGAMLRIPPGATQGH